MLSDGPMHFVDAKAASALALHIVGKLSTVGQLCCQVSVYPKWMALDPVSGMLKLGKIGRLGPALETGHQGLGSRRRRVEVDRL